MKKSIGEVEIFFWADIFSFGRFGKGPNILGKTFGKNKDPMPMLHLSPTSWLENLPCLGYPPFSSIARLPN